jgi:hypothetical protein
LLVSCESIELIGEGANLVPAGGGLTSTFWIGGSHIAGKEVLKASREFSNKQVVPEST